MSRESHATGPVAETEGAEDASLLATLASVEADGDRIELLAGLAGLAIVALGLALRILHNAPLDGVAVPGVAFAALETATPLALGAALFAVALAAAEPARRVGLLFAGAFGPLATISPAATLPAVGGVIGGGALAVVGSLDTPRTYREGRRAAVLLGFLAGVACSLAAAIGVLDGAMAIGAGLTLLATAALALLVETDRTAALAGLVTVVGVIAVIVSAPFLVGSVLLVGFGVVGVPHLLVALAFGGAVPAAVAGLTRGNTRLAVGASLVALAGVPATLPRAMAVLLGVALLVRATGEIAEVTT
ncbi:hypothetical protein [Halorientalis halophila]|uniref:hypothetical protein n=1 Tax=Halorientalis halophila TaxID=3108499 RepID=UPI003008C86E